MPLSQLRGNVAKCRVLTPDEYRAVLDKMGVETHPDGHIYLHITAPIEGGFRVIEIQGSHGE